jgi:hypothetical protein
MGQAQKWAWIGVGKGCSSQPFTHSDPGIERGPTATKDEQRERDNLAGALIGGRYDEQAARPDALRVKDCLRSKGRG